MLANLTHGVYRRRILSLTGDGSIVPVLEGRDFVNRLYMVSLFRNRQAANRRQTWLNSAVLERAVNGGQRSQRQIIVGIANSFRIDPASIAWEMLRFTQLPLFDDEHYLGE